MYEVIFGHKVYGEWASYRRWKVECDAFGMWLPKHYPEVLSVEWENNDGLNLDRIFRFENETHYHWFLLRQ